MVVRRLEIEGEGIRGWSNGRDGGWVDAMGETKGSENPVDGLRVESEEGRLRMEGGGDP